MGLLELLGLKSKGSPPSPGSAAGSAAAPPGPSPRDEARKPLAAILTQITALVLGGINDDDARNRINAELTKLQAKVDTADKFKDLKSAAKAWQALTVPAQALLDRATETKKVTDWVSANYLPLARPAQTAIAAVPLAAAKAVLQKAYDDLEADRKAREKTMDLAGIQGQVFPAMQKLHALSTRVAAAAVQSQKDLDLVAKQVVDLGAAATPKLKADLKTLQDQRAATWPAGGSVPEIEASVANFDAALKALVASAASSNESARRSKNP